MPRGYPDYFGQSIFPKYGVFTKENGTTTIAALSTDTVIKVTDKGRTYGARLHIDESFDVSNCVFRLVIDGTIVYDTTPAVSLKHNITEEGQAPFYLRRYDSIDNSYTLCLSKDITFEQSLEITFQNVTANSVDVEYYLYYAKVT